MSVLSDSQLPAPFVPVAICDAAQPLVLAVIIDERAAAPVVLRELVDGRVLLGCVLDGAGRLHRYLELWVQKPSALAAAMHLSPELLNNAALDEKWKTMAAAWAAIGGHDVISCQWQREFDRIVEIDLSSKTAAQPLGPSGKPLRLCRDEAALAAAKLPSYAATLHRFLTDGEQYFPVTGQDHANTLCLNPEGGPILLRTLHPVGLAAYCDFLGGAPAELSLGHDRTECPWLNFASDKERLELEWVLGSHGRSGRMIETLYLKLSLLLDAFRAVRDLTEQTGRPLFNLSADSFRVVFGSSGASLPRHWGARAALWAASEALPLSVAGMEGSCFIAAESRGEASYRAPVMLATRSGSALLTIRRVTRSKPDRFILEGTLRAPELSQPGKTDLVWLRLRIAGRTQDLWGNAEIASTTISGEFRFRSFEQPAGPENMASIAAAEGATVPEVVYSITPMLSSPCDLYALAVLATRILLVNTNRPLPIAIDELMSLSRAQAEVARAASEPVSLGDAIRHLFRKDTELLSRLGPHQMMYDSSAHAASARAIPVKLWAQVLGFVLRCFTGVVEASFARDAGDAPAHAIYRVFDPAIDELSSLVARAKNLIFVDSFTSSEIAQVIAGRARAARQLLSPTANPEVKEEIKEIPAEPAPKTTQPQDNPEVLQEFESDLMALSTDDPFRLDLNLE
jgi:hypothetical protein